MATFLVLVKKPGALPVLKGSVRAYGHLEPVSVYTSSPKLAQDCPEHVTLIKDMVTPYDHPNFAWRVREHKKFAFQKVPDSITPEQIREIMKPPTVLLPTGEVAGKRKYVFDTVTLSAAEKATLDSIDQTSIFTRELALSSACKLKAEAVK